MRRCLVTSLLLLLLSAARAEEPKPAPNSTPKPPAQNDSDDLLAPKPKDTKPAPTPKPPEKNDGDDLLAPKPAEPRPAPPKPASDNDDLLNAPVKTPGSTENAQLYDNTKLGVDPHLEIFARNNYPSATQCAECHQQIYDEWSSSNHAYASISPVFHKFEQTINNLSSGTIGTFCVRCHAGVGTAMNEPREAPLWKRAKVSREGVTCITCHRVNEEFNKVNGERRIVPGDIFQPVYGGSAGTVVDEVVKNKDEYKVATGPNQKGVPIHSKGFQSAQISTSEFCVSCHQVAVHPGIKLEVVWDQYRSSPARSIGIRCQDCHMGKVPGKNEGFATAPVANIKGKLLEPEHKHSNHAFYGPGYPIAHPGIFPQNKDNEKFPIESWLKFDYRAGWGTDAFEAKIDKKELKADFPDEWKNGDDRIDARKIVDVNLKHLAEKKELRRQVMENGCRIDGPLFDDSPRAGKRFSFKYKLTNIDLGHNLPSGSLGAQPEIWLNVALIDPDGKNVWESGYLDSNGDMCDLHSLDVRNGHAKYDEQLFNLQTKFLTTNVKGTDREMYLPLNLDIDPLPFIRPSPVPSSVLNHPPFIRLEQRSIPSQGDKTARYSIPGKVLNKPGKYKLAVRLRSRAEPIYFMKFIGATLEMEQAMNEWMLDIHPYTVEFEVKP